MALLDILMWVLPSGFLASLGTWILSRKTFSARNRKEQEVIYKQLYESQGDTLLKMDERITELQNQNIIINGNFAKMQRTLLTVATQAVRCRYWDVCPLRGELSKYKPSAEEYNSRPRGQLERDRHRGDRLRAGPDDAGEAEPDPDGTRTAAADADGLREDGGRRPPDPEG